MTEEQVRSERDPDGPDGRVDAGEPVSGPVMWHPRAGAMVSAWIDRWLGPAVGLTLVASVIMVLALGFVAVLAYFEDLREDVDEIGGVVSGLAYRDELTAEETSPDWTCTGTTCELVESLETTADAGRWTTSVILDGGVHHVVVHDQNGVRMWHAARDAYPRPSEEPDDVLLGRASDGAVVVRWASGEGPVWALRRTSTGIADGGTTSGMRAFTSVATEPGSGETLYLERIGESDPYGNTAAEPARAYRWATGGFEYAGCAALEGSDVTGFNSAVSVDSCGRG